jgi:hypothetical protein
MNAFDQEWMAGDGGNDDVVNVMENLYKKHGDVWSDVECRQMAIGLLLSVGTNLILNANDVDGGMERGIATAIWFLDASCPGQKLAILADGNERDILKFYSKRLSCSCLYEKYKEARKTLPKVGKCANCEEEKERDCLVTCGRCKVPFYCSRECHQVAHVPTHKTHCGIFVDSAATGGIG